MTAQTPDTVTYRGTRHALVGIGGTGLFDPREHGLRPTYPHTGCWAGFVCGYELRDDVLHLASLQIELGPRAGRPSILGCAPLERERDGSLDDWGLWYQGLGPVGFTGGLLIGARFIRSLYEHMGFAPAWKYEEVHELLFDEGRLTSATDRSVEIAEFRASRKDRPLGPDGTDIEQIKAWVERSFSRAYRW